MNVSPQAMEQARRLAAERLGLHLPAERDDDLRRALEDSFAAFRPASAEAHLTTLAIAGDADPVWVRLGSHLTVGETHFWRDAASVAELERQVLPTLIAARRERGTRCLRIWSAGCATGEEPYTLAILLDRALPDRGSWDLSVLGTDLNAGSISTAQRGRYGEWSLRDLPPAVRSSFFESHGPRRIEVAASIRQLVRFQRFNLVNGLPAEVAAAPVDLILCRNVLMYFTPDVAREVVARLRGALAPDGWLVVAPVEAQSDLFLPLRPVNFPGGIFFRQPASGVAPARPSLRHDRPRRHVAASTRRPPIAARRPPRDPEPVAASPADLKARARALADRGELSEARRVCCAALAAQRLDAETYRLLASIEQEQGDIASALDRLRRALYLEPDSLEAHLAFGRLLVRSGDRRRGQHHLKMADELRRRRESAS